MKAQINGFHGPLYKTFTDLSAAREWMDSNRLFPPGVHTPFHPAPNTPLPPDDLIYPPSLLSDDETSHASATATHDTTTTTATTTSTHPGTLDQMIHLLQTFTPGSNRLDPSLCTCNHCPYSTGTESRQQVLLLQRLFQLMNS